MEEELESSHLNDISWENAITYYVDIPTTESAYKFEVPWTNVESFQTKKEAIAFAQKYFGADENGMICIISQS